MGWLGSTNNQLVIEGRNVRLMRRPYQRSTRVTVKPNGQIRVTTGKSTSISDIQKFLRENQVWLKKALRQFSHLRSNYPRKQFIQSEGFMYLGEYHYLDFVLNARVKKPIFEVMGRRLECQIPRTQWSSSFHILPQGQIRQALKKFYEKEGREFIAQRVEYYSEKMGLIPTAVAFRSQKTRWGSCTPDGRLSLNWRLIAAPIPVIDYVVVHELAHLKFQNHSASFWQLVEKYCRGCKTKRQWLRDHLYEFDFLAKESELHPEGEVGEMGGCPEDAVD